MSKPATTVDLAAFKKQLADFLERSAKSAGQTIVKESLTCEIANGLQVVTAALKRDELPTEKELTAGIDLMFAYVSIDGQRAVRPGLYRIRLAIPGFEKKGDVKVSFIDAKGKTVHSLTGKGKPFPRTPGTDDATLRNYSVEAGVCSTRTKKCFYVRRNGFLDWSWGCRDANGNEISCGQP